MRHIVHEMRGIPLWLLKEYIQELGGTPHAEDVIVGPGWQVRLSRLEPFQIGSLAVGQVRLEMDLEDQVADDFLERFAKKTLRAGG